MCKKKKKTAPLLPLLQIALVLEPAWHPLEGLRKVQHCTQIFFPPWFEPFHLYQNVPNYWHSATSGALTAIDV